MVLFTFVFLSLSTLYGIVELGLGGTQLYLLPILKEKVIPVGMFLLSCIVGLLAPAFMFTWGILAPQYSTFGTQAYVLSRVIPNNI